MKNLLILGFLFSSIAFCNENAFLYNLKIGGELSSLKESRGVILYNKFYVDPVIAFNIYNDHFSYVGDSFSYKNYIIENKLKWRSMLTKISDHPFFVKNHNIRKGSWDWTNRLEFYLPENTENFASEISIDFRHELVSHHGNYLEFTSKTKLGTIKLFEPNFLISIGAGDAQNNEYYYGPQANITSFSNFKLGFLLLRPTEVDRFYSVMKVLYFDLFDSKMNNAQWAKGKSHGILTVLDLVFPLKF